MNFFRLKIGGWRYAGLLLLAVAVCLALFREYRSDVHMNYRLLEERGHTILESLSTGIQLQSRMGRYREDRLQEIFETLAEASGVLGIQLSAADGRPVVLVGEPIPPMHCGYFARWERDRLLMCKDQQPDGAGNEPGFHRGHGGGGRWPEMDGVPWAQWGPGVMTLSVMLDTRPTMQEIHWAAIKFVLSSLTALMALCLVGFLLSAQARQREMKTELSLAQERAAYHERLAQMGAGLAHETKNPLGLVRGLAQAIGERAAALPDIRGLAQQIIDETDRIVGQINSFLGLARPRDPKPVPLSLKTLANGLIGLVEQEASDRGVQLAAEDLDLTVEADEELLRRALLNLLINSIRACERGGAVSIAAKRQGDDADLSVRDTGCGIAPEDLPRVTEPYFTKTPGGTGLGLAIVLGIAHAHGWRLQITSTPGQGTEVSLRGMRLIG